MKLLFGSVGRIHIVGRQHTNLDGGFILAANHISHFDPFIISGVIKHKIDWMAMAEFYAQPLLGFLLWTVDAFPSERDRADLKTIRTAIDRLKRGRIVGVFPEGGIRDGARSLLQGAPLRPGVSALAQIAQVPILPCIILGSDRFYARGNWLRFRGTPIWIAFGAPIFPVQNRDKNDARARIARQLTGAFGTLYADLQQNFDLKPNDLPQPPRERMRQHNGSVDSGSHPSRFSIVPRMTALAVDAGMCASMNLLQSRQRLNPDSRAGMERYVVECERLTVHDYYAAPRNEELVAAIGSISDSVVTWQGPVHTKFPENDTARAHFFRCNRGWSAPTVLMLHALMSVRDAGYRRCAAYFNALGWNACFVHLPYHYSRVPAKHWNGELAITADLVRNAEGLRQGVTELRQLMAALREHGSGEFGVLGTSYGAWIGALLATVEPDFRFLALMAPIVNVEHAIWESPAAAFMRRELNRADIGKSLVARHFHLSSPLHNDPLCRADRVLFVAGEYDLIARLSDIEQLHRKWAGSELLRVRQGHFGYRMLRETLARLKERGSLEV
jgi:1-acyl-sn-glycerol-3-phosphate acyltransferase